MKFTKMHGLGNDYVYVNCFREQVKHPSELAVRVSDRHFGIGSDGLILIKPSEVADFEMEMYNADGSLGAMCGNGIRCVAKYVYDYGLTDKTQISVATGSGIKYLDLTVRGGHVATVRVDMGEPVLEAERIPVDAAQFEAQAEDAADGAQFKAQAEDAAYGARSEAQAEDAADGARSEAQTEDAAYGARPEAQKEDAAYVARPEAQSEDRVVGAVLRVQGTSYRATCVSMGNPHCIVCVDDVDAFPLEQVGPAFEHHAAFPDRVNTEFIRVLDRKTVQMRVWERGSGETWACGTGACAVAVACILNGWTEDEVTVKLRGGDLQIRWDRAANHVYMTGPATVVFDGELEVTKAGCSAENRTIDQEDETCLK